MSKILVDKVVLEQALEALKTNNQAWKHLADSGDAGFWEAEEQPFYETSVKAITALRAALAEPVQAPHMYPLQSDRMRIDPVTGDVSIGTTSAEPVQEPVASIYITPDGAREFDDWRCDLPVGRTELYAAPLQRKPLTEEEIRQIAIDTPQHAQGFRPRHRAGA